LVPLPKKTITFEEYMERCLYDPEHGYYTSGREVFGPSGDYYTSAHTHPVFAEILARCFASLFENLNKREPLALVELGPGRSFLGRQALSFLAKTHPELSARVEYTPVEVNRGVLPPRFTGIVFSNEFFDALPVKRVRVGTPAVYELLVEVTDRLREREIEATDARVLEYLKAGFKELRPGWVYEVNLRLIDWLEELDRRIEAGSVVTIDYGFLASEYNAVDRADGTLLSYYRHQIVADPFARPGEQDITAHVNFEVMLESARRLGWASEPLITQREFLSRWGLDEALAQEEASGKPLDAARVQELLGLKELLKPGGVSDTMRVLVQRVRMDGAETDH
jgi:SAM-dependent MidA family methyltransferase